MHSFCFQQHNSCNNSLSTAISLEKIRCFQLCIKFSKVFVQIRTAQSAIIREILWDELDGMRGGGGFKTRNSGMWTQEMISSFHSGMWIYWFFLIFTHPSLYNIDLYPSVLIQASSLNILVFLLYSTVYIYILYITVYIHTVQYSVHTLYSTVYIYILYITVYIHTLQYSNTYTVYSTVYMHTLQYSVHCTYS